MSDLAGVPSNCSPTLILLAQQFEEVSSFMSGPAESLLSSHCLHSHLVTGLTESK
ncbi:hypothetical protein SCLCIDRAFT_290731 [Scleroderma citrinum Foug A]|uniref:Uncharacterized protein n=1 Tax=Scleroderma citrinum Foug A TaxID=1036808 RepID=A0A0C2Z140_9AGAM|nr:hypothetical protein SCLCIDRAFT_290731 [Scleroderma citrinum Foug A]